VDAAVKRQIAHLLSRFISSTRGAILVEALIVVPVVTIFAVGLLEFGNVFWQRQQMQAGVRDAARYMSRCNLSPTFQTGTTPSCSLDIARNIAFYGAPSATGRFLRVPNWKDADDLTFFYHDRATNTSSAAAPTAPDSRDLVVVQGKLDYAGSPLIQMLQIEPIRITYQYMQRYTSW
jgi:Flp pilus assembly protein TadG